MILYHFTCREHLPKILESGYIKVTESNIHPTKEHVGPDVVWLTRQSKVDISRDRWFRGVGFSVATGRKVSVPWENMPEDLKKDKIRFTVNVTAVRWRDWVRDKGMPRWWKESMEKSGGGSLVTFNWYVTENPIDRSCWIEVRDMETNKVLFENG